MGVVEFVLQSIFFVKIHSFALTTNFVTEYHAVRSEHTDFVTSRLKEREVTQMVSFKACPRCNGDVVTKMDMYGRYNECLQCGHAVDLPTQRAVFNWTKGRLKPGRPRKDAARRDAA